MHSCLGRPDFKETAQLSRCRLKKSCLPFGIKNPCPSDMAGKMSFRDEGCKHRLLNRWRVTVEQSFGRSEGIDKVNRNNHIS
jgi:hypothetical protein